MTKIALLTPYSGSNLGDGAIQDAVIDNLRKRWPDVEVVMFTADPAATTRLHGVASMPLTGIHIPGYSSTLRRPVDDAETDAEIGGVRPPSLHARARSSPFIRFLFRHPYRAIKWLASILPVISGELRYSARALRQARSFDLIVVAGGGQIDDYWGGAFGHPYTLFRWSLLAKLAGTPFVLVSVGVCVLESRLSRWLVDRALRRAALRSYRDEVSKLLLAYMPFTWSDAIYPDLAFSHSMAGRAPLHERRAGPGPLCVGVSPIAYLSSHWPRQDLPVFDRYLAGLAAFTHWLLQAGHTVLVFATDAPDRRTVDQLVAAVGRRATGGEPGTIRKVATKSVDALFLQLEQLDLVVASRLHGIILSHLLAIPSLAISYDRKVDDYMRDMRQPELCLDIHDCPADTIDRAFRVLVERRDALAGDLQRRVADNHGKLDALYDRCAQLAEAHRRPFWTGGVSFAEQASVEK